MSVLQLRPFQLFLRGLFAFFAVVALILFINLKPGGNSANNPFGEQVIVWGPFSDTVVNNWLSQISDENELFSVVQYVQVPLEQFAGQFVNEIAEGRSPDLVMLPHTELVNQRSKLWPIPYDTVGFSIRDIRDNYIDGAEIFALSDGLYGLPFLVDPLLMYWNRDLFASAGLAQPPQSWEAVVGDVASRLTKTRAGSRDFTQSALAFGEYANARNASAVLSLLLMQSGSQLVLESANGYDVALNKAINNGRPPFVASLQFYADFANADKPRYSWNSSQQEDRSAFLASTLAMYFGFASEASALRERNPNLNFDVALPPQGGDDATHRTYGQFYSLVIPRAASKNSQGAFNAARLMANPQNSLNLAFAVNHAPVHRGALSAGAPDPYRKVAFDAALVARGWLSPEPAATEQVWQTMIEDVTRGRASVSKAVADALNRLILAY